MKQKPHAESTSKCRKSICTTPLTGCFISVFKEFPELLFAVSNIFFDSHRFSSILLESRAPGLQFDPILLFWLFSLQQKPTRVFATSEEDFPYKGQSLSPTLENVGFSPDSPVNQIFERT